MKGDRLDPMNWWPMSCQKIYFGTGNVIVISHTKDIFSVFINEHLMVEKQMKQSWKALVQGDHLWSKCIFCETDMRNVPLSQVQTFETSEKILSKAVNDREMICRLAGISDFIAAEGKYHLF